jgi:hypothetical protein
MLGAEPNPFTKPIFARPMRVRRTRSQKVPSQRRKRPEVKMHVKGDATLAIMDTQTSSSQSMDTDCETTRTDSNPNKTVSKNVYVIYIYYLVQIWVVKRFFNFSVILRFWGSVFSECTNVLIFQSDIEAITNVKNVPIIYNLNAIEN